MNGNRGAKGSIRDRIISNLYRIRYNNLKLKKENYTIVNKEKQINYLNNLSELKKTENIDVLDNKDKKVVERYTYKPIKLKRQVGISEQKLDNKIDSKKLEDKKIEKLDLKTEIKKTNQEITILKEVDKFIKTSVTSIDKISTEIKEIKTDLKDKNKNALELEEKYNSLKKEIDKLKKQYDIIKDKYDLSDFSIIESIKIIDSINDYKKLASLNELEMMVKVCKSEINKIDNITVVHSESKKLSSNIEDEKVKENDIKIKLNKSKDKTSDIKSIEEKISTELREQQYIIDDMYSKASYFEKSIEREIEFIGTSKILSSLLKIASGILTIPFTGSKIFGIALGTTMINKALKDMNEGLERREKIVVKYKYEDISNQINNVKDKVEYTNLIITDSLSEIKKLKNNFNESFKEYKFILPEYSEILEKVESLEEKLLGAQAKISKMDKKLEEEKEINKQKLKKVGF